MSRVEDVLAAHETYDWWPMTREFICKCEASLGSSYPDPAHRAHVAAALAAAGIGDTAAAEARGAERALRDAAQEARERGDIGRPDCIEVWDWLDFRADSEIRAAAREAARNAGAR